MKQLSRALVFLLALLPPIAAAQTFPTVPSGTVIGRTATGTGPAQAIPITTLIASMLNPLTVTSVNTASVVYRGATSGTVTVAAQSVAGTRTVTWPTASGTVPVTATSPIAINATTGDITCSTCVVSGVGYVSSIAGNTGAFTLSTGLTNTVNALRVSLSTASNVLGANVNLSSLNTYADGPSMAQGTSGTWYASGTVTLNDTSGTASNFFCKLWDGTTVIASSNVLHPAAANQRSSMALSGILASPAANIRITCKNVDTNTGVIEFNRTGESKDSAIYGFRIQ